MKEIPLTQGKVALVDNEYFEQLNKFKWCAVKDGSTFYAVRGTQKGTLWMHRVILNTPEGVETDHINGDGLNNQKSNLRVVTHRENMQNLRRVKTSRFPGVSYSINNSNKKWQTSIYIKGKRIWLGRFKTEEEAHAAYLHATDGEHLWNH